jgi:hypothetical protein
VVVVPGTSALSGKMVAERAVPSQLFFKKAVHALAFLPFAHDLMVLKFSLFAANFLWIATFKD